MHKVLEARVGAQGIEARPQEDRRYKALGKGFLQPSHCLILLTQTCMDQGNLGSIGIQIAKNVIGARVIAAAGSDARVALGRKLGADHGVNYTMQNIFDEVMKITGGKGVDVLYDNIANPAVLPVAFRAIGMDGRLVTAGAHAGPNVSIDFSHLYHKRITIKGRPGFTPSDLPHCLEAAAAGKVVPQIERVLPLSRAADAHRMVEAHEGQGKIVLDPTLG